MKYIIYIPDYVPFVLLRGEVNGKFINKVVPVAELEELNSDYINKNFSSLQDEAYQKGFEDGKKSIDKGCEGCRYVLKFASDEPCKNCCNCYTNKYEPMPDMQKQTKRDIGNDIDYLMQSTGMTVEEIAQRLKEMRN